MQADSNLKVDGDRLWESLMEMAKIGATPKGGVNRLTLTDLDRESRDLFAKWGAAAGCTLSVDQMGSMFLRRPGTDDTLPPVTPCVDGISHNEAEDMTKEWAEAGGSVLLHAALELAEVVS